MNANTRSLVTLAAVFGTMAASALAQDIRNPFSNGTGGGDFATGSTWVGGVVPGGDFTVAVGDTVTINAGTTVTGVYPNIFGTLAINGGTFINTWTINYGWPASPNFNVMGGSANFNFHGSGASSFPVYNVSGGTVSVGPLNSTHTLNLSGGTFRTNGPLQGNIHLSGGTLVLPNSANDIYNAFHAPAGSTWNGGTVVLNNGKNESGYPGIIYFNASQPFRLWSTNDANVLQLSNLASRVTAGDGADTNTSLSSGNGTMAFNIYSSTPNDSDTFDWNNSGNNLTLTSGVDISISSVGLAGVAGDYIGKSYQIFDLNNYANLTPTLAASVFTIGGMDYKVGWANSLATNGSVTIDSLTAISLWVGASGDWTTAANWNSNATPQPGHYVDFAGSGGTSTNNNALSVAKGIVFRATANGSYTVDGSALEIGIDGVVNSSSHAQTVALNLTMNGSTTINANTANLTISGGVDNNGSILTTTASAGRSVTISGVVSDSGALIKNGAGALILTGDNTYTGATQINSGTLQIGAGGTSGSLSTGSAITNNATLAFNRSNTVTQGADFANAISGTGNVIQAGSGTLVLGGANTYTGATQINSGTLQIGAGGTSGSLSTSSAITNNATLVFNRSNTVTQGTDFASVLSGTGNVIQAGSGTLVLNGNNTYTGATQLNSGTLQIGHANALGTSGDISFGGGTLQYGSGITTDLSSRLKNSASAILVDTNANNVTFASAIDSSNSGGLTKTGGGTLTLNATNTYSGSTTISGGTLQIGAGGTSGSLSSSSAITNNAALVFNRSNTVTQGTDFASVLSGTGNVTQAGSGTLVLGGANTHTGGTTINAGTVRLTGSIASGATTINSGGTLLGNGTAGSVTINSGGTISPGNSPGTITIGNSIWEGGGNYNWQLHDAAGSAGTGWDLISSAGSLTINSTNINKFNINLWSLSGINPDANGNALNFNASASGSWDIASFAGGISGFSADQFLINTAATNGTGGFTASGQFGLFSITSANNKLTLVYTAPSPMSLWVGASGDWTTAANWDNNATPVPGYSIEFAGSGGTSTNNNALSVANGLVFRATAGGSYTVDGSALEVGIGGVVNSSSHAQIVALNLTMNGSTTINADTANLTISGGVDNNGSVLTTTASAGRSVTISGVVSDSGALIKSGAGALILTGNNTYTGATAIILGTLQVGDNSAVTLGSGNYAGAIANSGTLVYNSTADQTLSGILSGAGSLVKSSSGTLSLTAANTYTGATQINSGTLQIGAGGTSGSLSSSSAITNNATLVFNRSNTVANFASVISGTGNVIQAGSGTLVLNGNNTYTGATQLNSGTLQIGHANALGTSGNISFGGGRLQYGSGITTDLSSRLKNSASAIILDTNANNVTLANAIDSSNSGGLTKTGGGTLTLNATNTYSGATTISGGTLQIGAGGTSGSLSSSSPITNNAALVFNRSNTVTQGTDFASGISGTGSVTQAGSGTLVLSGSNTYTGATNINAGNLTIGTVAALGSTSGVNMGDGTTLRYTGSSDTLDRAISVTSGNGTILNTGGALTLTGGISKNGSALTFKSGTYNINTTGISGAAANFDGSGAVPNLNVTLASSGNGSTRTITHSLGALSWSDPDTGNPGANATYIGGRISLSGYNPGSWADPQISIGLKTDAQVQWSGSEWASRLYIESSGGGWRSLGHFSAMGDVQPANSTFDFVIKMYDGPFNTSRAAYFFGSNATALTEGPPDFIISGPDNLRAGNPPWASAVDGFRLVFVNSGDAVLTTSNMFARLTWAADYLPDLLLDGSVVNINVASTYSGLTSMINGGVLNANVANALPTQNGRIAISMDSYGTGGSTLALGADQFIASLSGAASSNVTLGSSTLTIGTSSNATTTLFSGRITGGSSSALVKDGNSTLILTGNNTYSGTTTLNAGTLVLSGNGTLGTSTVSVWGGTLDLGGKSLSNTLWNVSNGTLSNGTITNNGGSYNLLSGTVSAVLAGTNGVSKTSSGTVTLTGNNTFTGNTTISGGTILLSGNGSLSNSAISLSGGTLDMGGKSLTNNLSSLTAGSLANGTISNDGGNYDLQNGTVSAVLAGTNGVSKTTSGTVTLTGNNTFTGTTTVSSGTLTAAASGALGGTTAIEVNGGSLLVTAGNSINDNATLNLNGGRLALSGNFSETLGTLTLSANSTIDFSGFAGTLRFDAMGSWSDNATLAIWNWSGTTLWGNEVNNYATPSRLVFTNATGSSFTSNLANISFYSDSGSSFIGNGFEMSGFAGGGSEIIAVPEPETWATGAILLLVTAYLLRRKKQKKPSEAGNSP